VFLTHCGALQTAIVFHKLLLNDYLSK